MVAGYSYGSHFIILSFSKEFVKWPFLVLLDGYCLEVNQFLIFGHTKYKGEKVRTVPNGSSYRPVQPYNSHEL